MYSAPYQEADFTRLSVSTCTLHCVNTSTDHAHAHMTIYAKVVNKS